MNKLPNITQLTETLLVIKHPMPPNSYLTVHLVIIDGQWKVETGVIEWDTEKIVKSGWMSTKCSCEKLAKYLLGVL